MKSLRGILLLIFFASACHAQVIILPVPESWGDIAIITERDKTPEKRFTIYPTIHKYDFQDLKLRVELYDDRDSLNLKKVNCSEIELENKSEFANPDCIYKVQAYLDSLLSRSGAHVSPKFADTLQVHLEGIESILVKTKPAKMHGLCQIRIKYQHVDKTYCADIMDGDKNATLTDYTLVNRGAAIRDMGSTAIREAIEKFFNDLTEGVY